MTTAHPLLGGICSWSMQEDGNRQAGWYALGGALVVGGGLFPVGLTMIPRSRTLQFLGLTFFIAGLVIIICAMIAQHPASTSRRTRFQGMAVGSGFLAIIIGSFFIFGEGNQRPVTPPGTAETSQGLITSQGSSQQAPASSTTPSPGTSLSHRDGVQLANSSLTFSDPNLHPSPISVCEGDLFVCDNGQFVNSSAPAQLAVIDGKAGYSQCQADTSYVSSGNAETSGETLVGKTLCVTTTDLIAVCYVTADTTQQSVPDPGLTMDVTVYQK
jgi:hypothetical protein